MSRCKMNALTKEKEIKCNINTCMLLPISWLKISMINLLKERWFYFTNPISNYRKNPIVGTRICEVNMDMHFNAGATIMIEWVLIIRIVENIYDDKSNQAYAHEYG